jgi:hypothetical protein
MFSKAVEDVRNFNGQTVTVSFWAKADAARTIVLQTYQEFGTGGSGAVIVNSTSFSATTSWQRFSVTFAMPSVSGKTITGNSSISFIMNFPLNTVQTIDITGLQIELGSVATTYQTATGTIQGELAACQRYYTRLNAGNTGIASTFGMGYAGSATVANIFVPLPVPMRRKGNDYLTLDYSGVRMQDYNTSYTVSAVAIPNYQDGGNGQALLVTSSGMTTYRPMELDTTNGGYIGFGAEL